MPLLEITPYVDGWYGAGAEKELTVIPKPIFPFENQPTPDTYSRQYGRVYENASVGYLPKTPNRTAATNLLLRSEEFENASWTKTALTPDDNAGTAPDGQATLSKLLETAANSEHNVVQAATVTAVPFEAFVFARAGLGRDFLRVSFTDSAAATFSGFFDVAAGVKGTLAANTTSEIVSLGNGDFQCIIRFTPAAGAGSFKAVLSTNGSTISYAGDTAKGMYLWGAQVAAGTRTPYISTTSAARAVSAPNRDKTDPMAYLVREDEVESQNSSVSRITRLFSRVPLEQTVPDSINVSKPSLSGSFPQVFGDFRLFQPDVSLVSYDAYNVTVVISDTGAPLFYPTGGTYTVTFDGDTTAAINYNDAAAAVEAALDALTAMIDRGGCAVTGSYNSAGGFLVALSYAAMTFDLTNLTTTGGTKDDNVVALNGGFTQSANLYTYSPPSTWTGGTFTISIFGQTTGNIAYNATAAQVQTALNLLSEVTDRGGCTVAVPVGYTTILSADLFDIDFTVSFALPAITGSSASLTPPSTLTIETGGSLPLNQFRIHLTLNTAERSIGTATPHGISESDTIFIKGGATYYGAIAGTFTVPNPTTIILSVAPADAYAAASTITEVGKRTKANYQPGTSILDSQNITTYFLPGVTPGITTADDIPTPTDQSGGAAFLEAVFAGTGDINYVVGGRDQYIGPIIAQTLTTIKAEDV